MNASSTSTPPARASGAGLGTFAGVFTPSVLTILGIILFLRLGAVVGQAGLYRALAIILLANAITVLTSVSLSAIATNLRVKGGGDYYLISRTLGVEFGGALGLVLFLAQSVSIGFYAIGFGEAVATSIGAGPARLSQFVAAGAVAALFALAWLGTDWATRFQYVVMGVLFAALVAFFFGGTRLFDSQQLAANVEPSGGMPFWVVFALFFPAVTGFTQGVSMSGDLRDPGRSLPRGTFLAVGLSIAVYLAVAVVFAGALPGMTLTTDYGAMRQVSALPGIGRTPWLVDAGVIAATLSSALASFLGAPRILQSLAGDRIFRWLDVFAEGHGPTANPRRGVLLAAVIALGTVGLGELNLIAPVVSMFFLISYGLLNYATYVEATANSPSFRPRFRFFHARLSLLGGLACLGAMLAIHATAAVVAVVLVVAVHQYVSSRVPLQRWADSGRSRRFQQARENLRQMAGAPSHPSYWRPVLLAFSEHPDRRARLLRFASWLEGGAGFTVAVRLLEGEGIEGRRRQREAEDGLREELKQRGLSAFSRAIVAPSTEAALPVLLQAYGLGPVRANTVLLNWFDRRPEGGLSGLEHYGQQLRVALRFGCNLVVLAAGGADFEAVEQLPPQRRRIDVWYRDNASGRLMLLLAYLMTRSEEFEDSRIRLYVPLAGAKSPDEALAAVRSMLEEVRIVAEVHGVEDTGHEEICRLCADAAVVFLPFRLADDRLELVFGGSGKEVGAETRITALVLAAEDIELDSEPESGELAEAARAVDAADAAQGSLKRVEREAGKAGKAVSAALERLAAARKKQAGDDEIEALEREILTAEEEVERAERRVAGARTKAEAAAREAEAGRPDDSAG